MQSERSSERQVLTTAPDLLAFSRHLFDGKLLAAATMVQMVHWITASHPLFTLVHACGLGVLEMHLASRPAYGHVGNLLYYSALLAYLPSNRVHIVVLLHQGYCLLSRGRSQGQCRGRCRRCVMHP